MEVRHILRNARGLVAPRGLGGACVRQGERLELGGIRHSDNCYSRYDYFFFRTARRAKLGGKTGSVRTLVNSQYEVFRRHPEHSLLRVTGLRSTVTRC